ncbi:aromatic ring-hydroxylating dioxygenase subunit alpha [Pigmentiphaga sp. D-2]|uniref:aromatic ring-hydroxylating oxygenase subunit alpha n=1 Tax=Pigmentiphaga sp. D-2 TaxID=1002116 RepID=UPI00104A8B0B|nr:aromatic ring-hydroxylating dioxygenase subunit alpha [Pigmentiphaga sp. D-2]
MNAPNEQLRWARKYPELGMDPIAVEPCVSPVFFEKEKERVFMKTWLKVGRIEEIAQPGDYKVKKIHFAKTSVILIHGKDGKVRGFHNTCSHRGNKVIVETGEETFGRNKAAVVTCRFHGWVYDAQGRLSMVPEQERFASDWKREDHGLTPVHTDVWEGFIFINLARGEVQPLGEYLGGIGRHLGGYPYAAMDECFSYHTTLDCNWKIALDAFSEAYHVSTIHAGSFPNVFSTGLADVQLFGDHRTTGVCLTLDAEPTPIARMANEITGASLVAKRGTSMLPSTVNPGRREDFSFELSVVFPNILIHVSEGIWFTHQFWPISHDKTLWEGKYYVPRPKTNSQRWAVEFAQVLQRNAWLEDTATMEDTHAALESGAKSHMILQDEEILLRHGYNVLERYMAAEKE